tara:strand:- start:3592 stop:4365 length:774 start_codon:yes stop_codon:yes gene_type:complete
MIKNYLSGLIKKYNNHSLNIFVEKYYYENNLDKLIVDYMKNSDTHGLSKVDYVMLHSYIRKYKPINILEFGSGMSSVIIADALHMNSNLDGSNGSLTTIENDKDWFNLNKKLFPEYLIKYVDQQLSKIVEKRYDFLVGNCYENIPDKDYDFIFIDGPSTYFYNGDKKIESITLDFINVLKKSDKPISALIDYRLRTCMVYSLLLTKKNIIFYKLVNLGFFDSVSKKDLLKSDSNFSRLMQSLNDTTVLKYNIPKWIK